ncbi:MAG: T9SS type A sorting domain-containing protein [Candidatus Marinimicrobia bacterium]|nr:T9SS type A sorting domain-containing protein [Candidatus Neomarinimicrobiota bacterium]MCF7829559.1 T9SS type A sorting domain-containing protein [Candidatus Neomarinimicrobiota bacterium]MCF7882009.1 T9SS type A sorting domain-containing protein [Candidatus Neomarinimicrobiota bacterium]
MRKLLLITTLVFTVSTVLGQVPLLDFENPPASDDSTFWIYSEAEADTGDVDSNYIDITYIDTEVFAGDTAMQFDYRVHDSQEWGGFAKVEHFYPDSNGTFDFSAFTDLTFSYYVQTPQSIAGSVQLRINLWDVSNSQNGAKTYDINDAEYWYSFHPVLDSDPGWNTQTISLEGVLGADQANSELFQMTNWSGITGNSELDLDKIKAVAIELSIASSQPEPKYSEGVVLLDHFVLEGEAEMPLVFFNGKAVPGNISSFGTMWSGSATVEEEAGIPTEGGQATAAIKWEGGDQWDGPRFETAQAKNMLYKWSTDSIRFDIKAEAGLGQLRLDFFDTDTDGDGTDDYPFEAHYFVEEADVGYDGSWKEVKVALADFNRNVGFNNGETQYDGVFDSTLTKGFVVRATGAAAWGKTIYLDNIWTGTPVIDNEAPAQVTEVSATPNASEYYNLVTWTDVVGESYETYDVYASTQAIQDLEAESVYLIAEGVAEDVSSTPHYLFNPFEDKQQDYYYAVVCNDQAGNLGPAGTGGPITGTARGIATISLDVPAEFAADGDFSEWNDITPIEVKPSVNNVVVGGFDDDNDLTASVWLAMDSDYLYIAADVIDNSYTFGTGDWWNQDALEMFIGLYDYKGGAKHAAYQRGEEPDFNLSIRPDGLHHQNKGQDVISLEEEFFWADGGGQDYFIETRIAIDSLLLDSDTTNFTPTKGMRIPMDIYMHDNDGGTAEGNIAFSPHNNDTGWQSPSEWTYTWLGKPGIVSVEDGENIIRSYRLSQNYPNPFNPTTAIEFALPAEGKVSIAVYNVLGERVATLLNEHKPAGEYQVEWNARGVSSGVYFYSIKADGFHQTKKMVLMK